MKKLSAVMAGILATACLGGMIYAQEQEVFADSFSGTVRDDAKWRDSIFLDSTAIFRILDGKVALSRNAALMEPFQQVQWDAKFVRLYDNNDYLEIGATVRIPHKNKTGDGAYSLGVGLVAGNAQFVELMVEDNADGRVFSLFFENTTNATSESVFFDAPQNVTTFDLFLTYSAATDTLAFYWSVPGVSRVFRIGEIVDFAERVGGLPPRRIRPYIIGVLFNNAPAPESWRVRLDDFYAFRENAP
jgi:hypothetical protein